MEIEQTIEDRLKQLGVKITSESLAEGKNKTTYGVSLMESRPAQEIDELLTELKAGNGFHYSVKLVNSVGGSLWIPESLLTKIDGRRGMLPPENAAEALKTAINTHNWENAFKDGIVSADIEISNQ